MSDIADVESHITFSVDAHVASAFAKDWMHEQTRPGGVGESARKMLQNFDILRKASFRQILDTNKERFHLPDDQSQWPTIEQVPILFRFYSYLAGMMILRFRDRRRVSGSDMGDAAHYALAGYVDIFVSDDKLLKAIYDLIPSAQQPFRLLSSAEFRAEFLQ